MTSEKDRAFAAALKELFKRYPLPEYNYPKVRWQREDDRCVALRNASQGCAHYLVDAFIDRHVPRKEIEAVRALIYG